MKKLIIAFVFWLSCSLAQAADLSGVPRVVDGDTLAIGSIKVRLQGIDAPETDQICLGADAQRWTCGITARERLRQHLARREVSCVSQGQDRYKRTLAVCSVEGQDVNAWLVREGLALAYVQYSRAYVAEEASARDARRGMWSGAFIAPWDWRHRDNKTVILGAVSVPVTAQAQLTNPALTTGAPSPDCIIKGNINRNGERIYHMLGQQHYDAVNMAKPGMRWFCSEEDAVAAGWRRSKQ